MDKQYNPKKISVFFQDMAKNPELMFQVFDLSPIPTEVFTPDGTTTYVNRAMLELNGVTDASLIVGKYNVLNDPVCNDQLGYWENIRRAFCGEAIVIHDFPAPIQDLVDRGLIDEKPYESAFIDLYFYSAWNSGQLAYVIGVFIVKNMYQGIPDVAKAKEYIESHLLDEFDPQAVAKAAEMSVSQLYSLFKRDTGITPGDYYKQAKVNAIKEKLADKNLTIAKAFAVCGANSRSTYAKVFKEITNMSPSEYRASIK